MLQKCYNCDGNVIKVVKNGQNWPFWTLCGHFLKQKWPAIAPMFTGFLLKLAVLDTFFLIFARKKNKNIL